MSTIILYAALLSILYIVISIRIIQLRRRLQIALGDGGNAQLLRAISVHSNFAEYVPLSLLLLLLTEGNGAHLILVHGLGASLLIGRILHAFGVSQMNENLRFRVTGMVLTFTTIITASGYLFVVYVGQR